MRVVIVGEQQHSARGQLQGAARKEVAAHPQCVADGVLIAVPVLRCEVEPRSCQRAFPINQSEWRESMALPTKNGLELEDALGLGCIRVLQHIDVREVALVLVLGLQGANTDVNTD